VLDKDQFENWIKASHMLFEIFEGQYDAYPLAKNGFKNGYLSENLMLKKMT